MEQDTAILLASGSSSAQSTQPNSDDSAQPTATPAELILSEGTIVDGDSLKLQPGQIVRAAEGRVQITVPEGGLAIDVEGVRFENIDFVSAGAVAEASVNGPLIECRAATIEFSRCTFQTTTSMQSGEEDGRPARAAIRWSHTQDLGRLDRLPSLAAMRIDDCIFRDVDAALDLGVTGPVALELGNARLCAVWSDRSHATFSNTGRAAGIESCRLHLAKSRGDDRDRDAE